MSEEEYFDEEEEEDCANGECYRTLTSDEGEYDPDIMELSDAIAEGDLDENGIITESDVLQGPSGGWGGGIGNVLSPGLPQYLRNSLLPLDTWQSMETDTEHEQDIAALEDELANAELQARLDSKTDKKSKITRWHMMMIGGSVTTLIAISVFIYKRAKKRTRTAAPSPPPVS